LVLLLAYQELHENVQKFNKTLKVSTFELIRAPLLARIRTSRLGRIGYPDNFKVSGSRSLFGGSIILLSLSGYGVLFLKIVISGGYPDPDLNP